MADITKYYSLTDALKQYGQINGEVNPNATTMQDMQSYMQQNGDTLENVVKAFLWQPETNIVVGQEVHSPNLPAGYMAVCTTAGTTGTTEPSWSISYSTFTDGTVTWTITSLYSGKVNKANPADSEGNSILTEADVLTLEEIEASTSLADTDVASASALKDGMVIGKGEYNIAQSYMYGASNSDGYAGQCVLQFPKPIDNSVESFSANATFLLFGVSGFNRNVSITFNSIDHTNGRIVLNWNSSISVGWGPIAISINGYVTLS